MNGPGLVSIVIDELRTHRSRAALSVASILVGVATLTVVVALGDLAQSASRSIIERQVGRPATLRITSEGSVPQFAEDIVPLAAARLTRYGVRSVSPELTWSARVVVDGIARPEALTGVWPGLTEIRAMTMVSGRWLEQGDDRLFAPVLVSNRLAAGDVSAGCSIGCRPLVSVGSVSRQGRVVGVVDDGASEARIYLGAAGGTSVFGLDHLSSATLFARADPSVSSAIAVRLLADLRSAGFEGTTVLRVDATDAYSQLFVVLQLVLGAIAGVSLVSGALGILNLGLVTARQRATEFAIRRAFGATEGDIAVTILAETTVTTLLGGLLGIAVGAVLVAGLSLLAAAKLGLDTLPIYPANAALVGVGVSLAIGALAGLPPARLARRLSIIATIRG